MSSHEGWLSRTGQKWKVIPGIIAVLFGLVALMGLIYSASNPRLVLFGLRGDTPLLLFGFMLVLLGGVAFGWFVLAFKCPACRAHTVWRLMTGDRSSQWYYQLLTLEECPACGFDGRGGTDSPEAI